MHEVLVNRLGGLSLPRKSVVRLTDRPDMTLDVYRGRKTTMQHITCSFVKFGCLIGIFSLFCKSDMSNYGYLEVFQRVPSTSR